MRFIGFEREISAEKWARPLLGLKDEPEFFRAMSAVDDEDKFVCTAIFNNFTPRNIDVSFASRGGNWASPKETLRMFNAIFTYIFMGESIFTTKTMTCMFLASIIIYIQIFWK